MKARSIMIQGTASSVGKSLITAGLCRIFRQDGYKTAPFKSQNMVLNSYITLDGKEMGRAQVVQAEAAGIEPHADMNPILIKPTEAMASQVIINGAAVGNMTAAEYNSHKPRLREMIRETYERLAVNYDVIVIEGAGSPAEINLKEEDIVNMGMAEIADSPVILVGDIDRGGVFASIAGTMLLLDENERSRVKGVIINKFRGDVKILEPGLRMLENIIKVPVLGVIPYASLSIDDEDGFLAQKYENSRRGAANATDSTDTDIAVVRFPHISNDTDFNLLENIPGVRVRYVTGAGGLGTPDLIILPGTKNTAGDLMYMRDCGLENMILELNCKGTPVFGICGGFQMLGREIDDPDCSETKAGRIKGMGLLEAVTVFQPGKTTTRVKASIMDCPGLVGGLAGLEVEGYEIHMGATRLLDGSAPFTTVTEESGRTQNRAEGACNGTGTVFGTYIHGILDSKDFILGLVNSLRRGKGLPEAEVALKGHREFKEEQYDRLADIIREHLDINAVYSIINGG